MAHRSSNISATTLSTRLVGHTKTLATKVDLSRKSVMILFLTCKRKIAPITRRPQQATMENQFQVEIHILKSESLPFLATNGSAQSESNQTVLSPTVLPLQTASGLLKQTLETA